MTNARFSFEQRRAVLTWASTQSRAWTVEELAKEFSLHPATAQYWKAQLESDGSIIRHPLKRGKRTQYFINQDKAPTPVGGEFDPDSGALKIVMSGHRVTPAYAAANLLTLSTAKTFGASLIYLFIRSYYAEGEQHMRGTIPAQTVRTYVVSQLLPTLRSFLEIAEQLIAISGPWVEGPEFAERFGTLPNGVDLQQCITLANQFNALMLDQMSTQVDTNEE